MIDLSVVSFSPTNWTQIPLRKMWAESPQPVPEDAAAAFAAVTLHSSDHT